MDFGQRDKRIKAEGGERRNRHSAAIVLLMLLTIGSVWSVKAQALWEIGGKAGESFYLGDRNRTLFNDIGPGIGGYFRCNWNPHWATKVQVDIARIGSPLKKNYVNADVQMEFNFFEYGEMNSLIWSRYFTPYICGGIGLGAYNNDRKSLRYTVAFPFGVGIKCKIFRRYNIGVEWTMHKLCTDKFDLVDNPYRFEKRSSLINNDWYSMCMLFIGIDLGDRNRFCKN